MLCPLPKITHTHTHTHTHTTHTPIGFEDAILSEKYAHDYTWYVDTILNLICLAGDYMSEEVCCRIVQVVINTQEVQGYAAKMCFEVSSVCMCVCVCVCVYVCVCVCE